MRGQLDFEGWLGAGETGVWRWEVYRGDSCGAGGDPWGCCTDGLLPQKRLVRLTRPGWAGSHHCWGKGSRVRGLPQEGKGWG